MAVASPFSKAPQEPIAPPVPDAREVAAVERDADVRADRALRGRGLDGEARKRPPSDSGQGFQGLGPGRPLPPPLSERLSRSLGVDLSDLRLHADGRAAERAEAMGARAAIAGRDIVLGEGEQDLSRPETIRTVAHEAAHYAQSAERPDLPPVLRRDKGSTGGIGRAPPKAEFARGTGVAAEDDAVTFAFDSADLTAAARASLEAMAGSQTGPVLIDLYGYASTEGEGDYNVNLSAHRALAVKRFLQPLLPQGSVIRLHAHGEIAKFEPQDDNRRVGIDVAEKAVSTETPAQVPGMPKPSPNPPANSGGKEPAREPAPPGTEAEPPTQVAPDQDAGVPSPDADAPSPSFVPRPLPLRFRIPLRRPIVLNPPLAGTFFQFPPLGSDPASTIDYLPLAQAANARGVSLIDLTGRGELEGAYALHRRLYPWIPISEDEVDNWLVSKLVGAMTAQAATQRALGAHLAREHPGVFEESERLGQIDRAMRGEGEPLVIPPITVLELEFDLSLGVFRKK